MKRKRTSIVKIVAVFVLVLALGTTATYVLRGQELVIELTEDEIQKRLDEKFPIVKDYADRFLLTYSKPDVAMEEGSDRIAFSIETSLDIRLGKKERQLHGGAMASSAIRYDPTQGAFYLIDPELEKLDIQGIPIPFVNKVQDTAEKLIGETLNNHPVYRLKDSNLKQAAAKLFIKDVVVRDGKLVITLGM